MWAGIRYPASAEVLDDSVLLVVRRSVLKDLIARNADLALAMLGGMSTKLREFNQLIERLSLKDVPSRLASVLMDLLGQSTDGAIRLGQSKRELASQIGAVPETLSRALKKLTSVGIIEVSGRSITVLNPAALAAMAQD